ncbi:hypothetical protein [Chroococcidiopsis sp.]|uniref:hypothetical protein n=1 Tax=Chroococcidiopsis sp. TaxID=3088168 RepID=UPI003F2F870F
MQEGISDRQKHIDSLMRINPEITQEEANKLLDKAILAVKEAYEFGLLEASQNLNPDLP